MNKKQRQEKKAEARKLKECHKVWRCYRAQSCGGKLFPEPILEYYFIQSGESPL